MISWMQKHNKYLVWTIWVATITFIGAGFVGWGSYSLGSKASAVAQIGNISVKQARLNMVYANLYERYRTMFQGNFDDKKAEELGLLQQAFGIVKTQALLLNYAKEIGIVVTDEEVAHTLETLPLFQNNGVFDKEIYKTYLKNRGLKPKTFENALRDEIAVDKLMRLVHLSAFDLETETVSAALGVSDKIKYRIVTPDDVNVTLDETAVRAYWEQHKEDYLTPTRYKLAVVWIDSSAKEVKDDELKTHYETNSFNYIDANGTVLSFEEAKPDVLRDVRLAKSKKTAQLAYIDLKKGRRAADETLTLVEGDQTLSPDVWKAIVEANKGDILKPKVVGTRYAVVKVIEIIEPHPMAYEEAKPFVTKELREQRISEKITELSQSVLKEIDKSDAPVSDFLSLNTRVPLNGLNLQEMSQFLQKLFTSDKEKGIISVSEKKIVYTVVEQKLGDANRTEAAERMTNAIKRKVFEPNFIDTLDRRYPTEIFVKGLTP